MMNYTDDFDFDFDTEQVFFPEFEHSVPVYYYEAGEILNLWNRFGRCSGIPEEQRKLSPEETDLLMLLFHVWKKLYGYSTLHPLGHSEMDTLLHIHHFDLLTELYFNHKFRNFPFTPGDFD